MIPVCHLDDLPARRPVRTHRVSVDDGGFVHVQVAADLESAREGSAA
ncbi:Rieske (2Fe-2S) protein [Streptomyces albidochromogenes]|uniref:Uncharacterized protein n=1 Tax=Streptomyces albidochromogenes TaxID=329524 RepID=A0ABW6FQS1_9ACTN